MGIGGNSFGILFVDFSFFLYYPTQRRIMQPQMKRDNSPVTRKKHFTSMRLGGKNLEAGEAFKGFVKGESNGRSRLFIGTA
jgi:hypothetical protein